jgi:hypothetical protein
MMHTIAILTLFQLAAPSGVNALVSSPTLGYILTGNRLVRLAGVPGACYTTADATTTQYTQAHNASAAQATLLVTGGTSVTLIYRTPLTDITITLPEPPQHTAISPTGSYFAALTANRLSLYRRSSSAPVATVEPPSLPIPADVTALAIGDYGDTVLTTPTAFWYSASPGASFTSISIAATFLRFTPRDHLLIAYDAGQGRIIALHPTSSFAIEPLITSQDALTAVTGLEFSPDALSIWVTQQTGPLLNYSLPGRHLTSFPLPAGGITAVIAPGVFLWSQPDQQTAILDTTRSTPTILIVPAGTEQAPSK